MSNDSIAKTFRGAVDGAKGQVILQAANMPYYKPFWLFG